jgi:L-lactate dehydrogenase complex protein LldG
VTARDAILARIRSSLGVTGKEPARAKAIAARMQKAPAGVIPARGQLAAKERTGLFVAKAEAVLARVARVETRAAVPEAVTAYLREKNLPAEIVMGSDERLAAMPWKKQKALTVKAGASDGSDEAGLSFAFGAIAETGTLMLTSGPENPTTINFLPEHHIVVLDAADIEGDVEALMKKLREHQGRGRMPRTVNLITGPSRSGDIEQTIILGAHGPRALHIILVGA